MLAEGSRNPPINVHPLRNEGRKEYLNPEDTEACNGRQGAPRAGIPDPSAHTQEQQHLHLLEQTWFRTPSSSSGAIPPQAQLHQWSEEGFRSMS